MTNKQKLLLTFLTVSFLSGCGINIFGPMALIKEDSNNLYGFLDSNEKKLFDTVIKINGVGPKAAMAICSTFTPSSFAEIVETSDVTMLKRVPGIGPKGASRILVELTGFVI